MIKYVRFFRDTIHRLKRKQKILTTLVGLIICLTIMNFFSSDFMYNSSPNNLQKDEFHHILDPKTSVAPNISVNIPINYSLFGKTAPDYSISITGGPGNYTWYEFLEISNKSSPIELSGLLDEEVNGTFDQDLWDNLSNGTVTIRFYANDSLNAIGYSDAIIRVDIIAPGKPSNLAAIPSSWVNTNSYNLSWSNPSEPSGIIGAYYKLDEAPVSDDNGTYVAGANIESITDISVSTDGNHTVYVWLVDAAGNINYSTYASTQLYLDTLDPLAPSSLMATPNSWTNIDSFNLSWSNPSELSDIIGAYYKLDKAPVSDDNGTYVAGANIELISDISLSTDGNHTVYVWLVDAAGNINYTHYASTQLYLDTSDPMAPSSLLATPNTWTNIDSFNITWVNPSDMSGIIGAYYKLEELPVSDDNGTYVAGANIESIFDIHVSTDGNHTVYVWLVDAAGNINHNSYASTQLFLDTSDPIAPSSLMATPNTWTNIDSFNLSWSNPSDMSGIVGAYYKLGIAPLADDDGTYVAGVNIESITDISVSTDGNHTVYVWLVDAAGNIHYTNYASTQLYLDILDPTAPSSLLATPNSWTNIDSFNITWINPSDMSGIIGAYYKLDELPVSDDNGTYIAGADIESFSDLSVSSDGNHTVYIWLVDTAGNVNYNNYGTVQLYLDASEPLIIDSQDGDDTWRDSGGTTYNIDFSDGINSSNLDFAQYIITSETGQGGLILKNWTNIFTDLGTTDYVTDWTIDFTACQEGINYVSVRVYDKVGNIATLNDVFYLKKDTINPILVINDPVNNTYYDAPPSINITVYEPNPAMPVCIYTVGASSPIWLDNNSVVSLDQDIWDNLPQGAFQIRFTSFDIFGEAHKTELTFTLFKDTLAPSININFPANNTYWNSAPYLNISAIDPNLDTIWYSINNNNISLTNNTLQQLNNSIWSTLPDEGEFKVRIYANDTFGHINANYTLLLYKDVVFPTLIINSPLNNSYHKLAPFINISVLDPYFDSLWYQVGVQEVALTNNTSQQLLTSIWEELPEEGEFIIYFYANDTSGNLNNLSLLKLNKDIRNPSIFINNPKANDLFGDLAPNFEISINETNLAHTWYTLIGGSLNYSFIGFSGQINQSAWNEFGNGTVTIRFYANDTLGHLGYIEVTVRKNIFAPVITITFPQDNDLFGINAPNFTIYKSGIALNTTWYTLDNGLTNYTFSGLNGTIDQDAWDFFGFEDISITFYINDTLGKIGFDTVTVRKDPDPPVISITIINPIDGNNSYCSSEPIFRVSVYEPNLYRIWYKVGNISVIISNNTDITLESSIWDDLPQAKFIINIFAEDLLGYIDSVNLTFYKDTLAPKLIINDPYNQTYYNSPPPINVTIYEPNPAIPVCTYTVGASSPIWLDNNTEVSLDQDIWDNLPQGVFQIRFSAYDSFGHHNNTVILTLYKDTVAPTLLVTAPKNNTCWNSQPLLNVLAFDPNLDTIWYRFGTATRKLFNNTQQAFDFTLWESISEGFFTVEFFANDTFGEISTQVNITLIKDITYPTITINSPNNNTYYALPPTMDITGLDDNFDTLWYTVMGSKIILTSGPEPLDSNIWINLLQGEFQVFIFANDTAGNINDTVILTLYKDTMAPLIIVNSPQNNTFWNSRPILNIMAFDPNLDSISYTSLGYLPLTLLNNTDELFNNLIWTEIEEEGIFLIEIFAEDTFGHINSINLTLYKDTHAPETIINFPLPNGLFGDIAPDFDISVIESYLNTTWYMLYNQTSNSLNYTFSGLSGLINQSAWDEFGNGTVTIRFYANDTVGNLGYNDITVRKDIFAPVITINSPGNDEFFGINSPNFIIYKSGPGIQATWYTLDDGLTNYTFTGLSGKIHQAAWDNFDYEIITIRFYVNNSLGKIGYDEVIVRKDPDAPIILVTLPFNQTAFSFAPLINLTIIEPNLDTVWYIVDDITIDLTSNLTQYLDSFIWNNLPQGTFILEFFANDTLGNLNNLFQYYLSKDTLGPNITIILPDENQRVDRDAPFFELTIFDENGIALSWYTLDGGNVSIEFTGAIGRIDQALWELIWDNKTHGSIISIRFYSQDNLGNVDYQEVIVTKYQPPPPFKILSNPLGFILSTVGLGVMFPVTIKLARSRYYENLNNKEKSKLKKVLIAGFLLLSVMVLFYIF